MSSSFVFFLIVIAIIAARHKRERRYLEERLDERSRLYGDRPSLPDNSKMEREMEDLRDRVRVLERIVTDANTADARNSRRISDEIEALRDREHS